MSRALCRMTSRRRLRRNQSGTGSVSVRVIIAAAYKQRSARRGQKEGERNAPRFHSSPVVVTLAESTPTGRIPHVLPKSACGR